MSTSTSMRQGQLMIVGLIVLPVCAGEPVRSEDQVPSHIAHFAREHQLILDLSQVALHQDPERGLRSRTMREAGLDPRTMRPGPLEGWVLVDMPDAGRSSAKVQTLLADLDQSRIASFVSPVFLDTRGEPVLIMRDLFVAFEPMTPRARALAVLAAANVGVITDENYAGIPNVYRLRCDASNGLVVLERREELARLPEVRYAEPDLMCIFYPEALIPDDPNFVQSWALNNTGQTGGRQGIDLDAPQAWDLTTGDPSVIVLVLDVGIQQDHPDLNQVPGMDFTFDAGDGGPIAACDNHGTLVAGCITGIINNALGSVGIAPNCTVASARVFQPAFQDCASGGVGGVTSWIADGVNWGQSIGARVSNFSFTTGSAHPLLANLFEQTREAGMIHFAATGNDGTNVIGFPANLPSVNAVGAVDHDGTLASFSTTGDGLAFVAPGVSIFTTDRTGAAGVNAGDFAMSGGTSLATAFASGTAAMVLSVYPSMTPGGVHAQLRRGIDLGPLGYDPAYGWGMVNAFNALRFLPPDCNGNGIADWIDIRDLTSEDCNANEVPDECDIAVLESPDCNANGVPDECDLALGQSFDCDNTGIPDECEFDCNGNGLADSCDIADGDSADCNANGIPDECTSIEADCNLNGVPDACDIASLASPDCNDNGLPDECDLSLNLSADCDDSGVPDECKLDCDRNGLPDPCELIPAAVSRSTSARRPIGANAPISFTFAALPLNRSDVTMHFEAKADLQGTSKTLRVLVNGIFAREIFRTGGTLCADPPNETTIVIEEQSFSDMRGGAEDIVITVDSVNDVDPDACGTNLSTLRMDLDYQYIPADLDGNGMLDICERPGDLDHNAIVNVLDLLQLLGQWGPCSDDLPAPPCPADLNDDNFVTVVDLLMLLGNWG